jgi:hypothetical protein
MHSAANSDDDSSVHYSEDSFDLSDVEQTKETSKTDQPLWSVYAGGSSDSEYVQSAGSSDSEADMPWYCGQCR